VIGRYFPFRRRGGPGAGPDFVGPGTFVRRLGHLVGRASHDLGQHRAEIAQVNRQLAQLGPADGTPLAEVVLDAIAQVADSNVRLQHRLAAAEEKLQHQAQQIHSQISEARTDSLTELPNRRAFRDELDRQIALWQQRRTPFALLMVDADRFKGLNDRYGHPAGDLVLRSLGETLRGAVRQMDVVARVGGEEFAVILPGATAGEALRAAEAARSAVDAARFRFERCDLHATVSVGAAVVLPGDSPLALIKRADEALYASKRAGRNCGHFHDGAACRKISSQDASAARAEDHELGQILRELRARLAEIAGQAEPAPVHQGK
jgi:diguanylate cyclase